MLKIVTILGVTPLTYDSWRKYTNKKKQQLSFFYCYLKHLQWIYTQFL